MNKLKDAQKFINIQKVIKKNYRSLDLWATTPHVSCLLSVYFSAEPPVTGELLYPSITINLL